MLICSSLSCYEYASPMFSIQHIILVRTRLSLPIFLFSEFITLSYRKYGYVTILLAFTFYLEYLQLYPGENKATGYPLHLSCHVCSVCSSYRYFTLRLVRFTVVTSPSRKQPLVFNLQTYNSLITKTGSMCNLRNTCLTVHELNNVIKCSLDIGL